MGIVNNHHGHKGVEGHAKKGTLPREDGGIRSEVKEQVKEHEANVLKDFERFLDDYSRVGIYQISKVLDGGNDLGLHRGEGINLVRYPKSELIHSERDLSIEQILEVLRQLPPAQGSGVRGCETSTQYEVPSAMEISGRDHQSEGPGEGDEGFQGIDNPDDRPGCVPSYRGDNQPGVIGSHGSDSHCPSGQGQEGSRGIDHRTNPDGSGRVHIRSEGRDVERKELPILVVLHDEGRPDALQVYRYVSGKDPEAWKVVRPTDRGESPRPEAIWSPIDLHIEPHGQNGTGPARLPRTLQYGANETVYRGRSGRSIRDPEGQRSLLRKNVPERIRPESDERIDVPIGKIELEETEKVHEWVEHLSRKYEGPQTGGIKAKEREAGDRWLEFLEPNFVDEHLAGVFRY